MSRKIASSGALSLRSKAALKKVLAVNAINTFDEFLWKAGHLTGDNLTEHETIWLQHLNRVFSAALNINFVLVSLNLLVLDGNGARHWLPTSLITLTRGRRSRLL